MYIFIKKRSYIWSRSKNRVI